MAHIRYGTFMYDVPDSQVDELTETIKAGLRPGGVVTLNITDSDGDVNTLFISPGVPISIHDWDSPTLA